MSSFQPMSLLTAQACAAKASLASTGSRSCTRQPAFSSARREDGIGPVPMMAGSTPAVAHEAMRASGVRPRFCASDARMTTKAAAPSLMPEALPAVTVPSFEKAGLSLATDSSVVPARMYSSASTTMSPLRVLIVTGAISSLNLPALGHVLSRGAHVVALEGVQEAVLQHGVDELEVTHLGAGAHVGRVRRH